MERIWPNGDRELKETVPLQSYLRREYAHPRTPFKAVGWWQDLKRTCVLALVQIVEWVCGTLFLVENSDRELATVEYGARQLLAEMIRRGVVASWDIGVRTMHGGMPQFVCTLRIADVYNENGDILCSSGSLAGHGSASNPSDALVIAEAEALERIAATQWQPSGLVRASVSELDHAHTPYLAPSFVAPLTEAERDEPIGWRPVRDLGTGKETLAPLSLLYLFYKWRYPKEPTFIDLSSSGVAAHITRDRALLGALYESFERDGLLLYWLNNLSPQRIDLKTILVDDVTAVVRGLENAGFAVHFLDCKTEYGIPLIVMVTIDNATGGVSVHAAAGADPARILQKLCMDTLRWDTSYRPEKPSVAFADIVHMEDREALWYGGYMREYIDTFVSGPVITYTHYGNQFSLPEAGAASELQWVKRALKKNGSAAFMYAYQNALAAEAGLHVVRAIVPDLMPIYFSEAKKHLNVPRLYTFGMRMGLRTSPMQADELNPIPHPFI